MADVLKVIGLMSGTSLDGIDAALVDTDGEAVARPGPALSVPYGDDLRDRLKSALALAAGLPGDAPPPAAIASLEQELTDAHAEVVRSLLAEAAVSPADIALIGFHGQTILHRPKEGRTWQIGNGALLAELTGIDVVNDFRSADVAAGGQGAPLVPLYHAALVRAAALELPVAVVNIGGVANVTYVDAGTVLAFDTGPGNAPIDDWALLHTGMPVDRDGRLAARGQPDDTVLSRLLTHPFFGVAPPKSLDRMDFRSDAVASLSPENGAATLTAFTAASIARARIHFPDEPTVWIVSGGGRHNPTLMKELETRTGDRVISADALGWRGDFIEAEAFAYLAARAVRGLPLSIPTTTGVPVPLTGGQLHRALATPG